MRANVRRSILPLLVVAIAYSQSQLPPPTYSYVVVTYKCGASKNIQVFSQVFGACYQETNHSKIAAGQRDTFARVAAASCGATITFDEQRSGYPFQGPAAQDSANKDREKDIHDAIGYGFKVESAQLQVPYSTKCSH